MDGPQATCAGSPLQPTGGPNLSLPAVEIDQREVLELAEAVQEPAQRLARGAVGEIEVDLADAKAGARRIDVHRGLHPEPRAERHDDRQHRPAQRALTRDRRGQLEAGEPSRRPAREADGEAEAAAHLDAE